MQHQKRTNLGINIADAAEKATNPGRSIINAAGKATNSKYRHSKRSKKSKQSLGKKNLNIGINQAQQI